jgi:micrococcal nuclease
MFFLLSGGLLPSSGWAENVTGQVMSVGDGDTIRVSTPGKILTVRLACIDAPETAQAPYGKASRRRLQELLPLGQTVTLGLIGVDRYGRTIAKVNKNSLSIILTMVKEGQAVVYSPYLSGCPELKNALLKAESSAKRQRLGFWSQGNPTMPWDFRRGRSTPVLVSPTLAPNPQVQFPRAGLPACTNSDCNCSDFSTQAAAQQVLKAFPDDRFGLDRDRDGIACELLK